MLLCISMSQTFSSGHEARPLHLLIYKLACLLACLLVLFYLRFASFCPSFSLFYVAKVQQFMEKALSMNQFFSAVDEKWKKQWESPHYSQAIVCQVDALGHTERFLGMGCDVVTHVDDIGGLVANLAGKCYGLVYGLMGTVSSGFCRAASSSAGSKYWLRRSRIPTMVARS